MVGILRVRYFHVSNSLKNDDVVNVAGHSVIFNRRRLWQVHNMMTFIEFYTSVISVHCLDAVSR
jgi:hypothetical protein